MATKKVLKTVTLDVTGTLFKFKMHIGQIYCISASKCGQPCPDWNKMLDGFHKAYELTGERYKCFGAFDGMSAKDWWRECVYQSFVEAGYDYKKDSAIFEKIFNRIYALFGSREPYHVFEDVTPFLDWCKSHRNIKLGVITNASDRYRTTILPILDLDPYFDFIAVAKEAKAKKPDRKIFEYAASIGDFQLDETWVHIGDNIEKDFKCVNEIGGHGILLNRFDNEKLLKFQVETPENLPIFEDLAAIERHLAKNWTCK
eukprot:CAMPEP_0197025598 /NCGR_PEP_ID=MMETSP1384-20130603/5869_1 /TAXON_ID=29189 /ORGANISM="Ammonia sp." /LENGTH=257 /DNA_ID=CAMNT_0042454141 /DNA_START=33 /DNA_END=806 /DNA_ORIENTATION=+